MCYTVFIETWKHQHKICFVWNMWLKILSDTMSDGMLLWTDKFTQTIISTYAIHKTLPAFLVISDKILVLRWTAVNKQNIPLMNIEKRMYTFQHIQDQTHNLLSLDIDATIFEDLYFEQRHVHHEYDPTEGNKNAKLIHWAMSCEHEKKFKRRVDTQVITPIFPLFFSIPDYPTFCIKPVCSRTVLYLTETKNRIINFLLELFGIHF